MAKFTTTKEAIEHALRGNIRLGQELDWDTLLSKDAMQVAYDLATSMDEMGRDLQISKNRVRTILIIHGIQLRPPGGLRKNERKRQRAVTTAEMHEIGQSYGFSKQQILVLQAHSSKRVRLCPVFCPLAVFCWDGSIETGKRKKQPCGLQDHLVAVGLMEASDV